MSGSKDIIMRKPRSRIKRIHSSGDLKTDIVKQILEQRHDTVIHMVTINNGCTRETGNGGWD